MNIQERMVLGISGACRRHELYNMIVNDIEEREGFNIIKMLYTKTNFQRSFEVIKKKNEKHTIYIFFGQTT